MGLPCHLHDEAHLHTGVGVRAAETIHHIEAFAAELFLGHLLDLFPNGFRHLVVVVRIFLGSPPDLARCAFLRGLVIDDVFVFRAAAGELAGHHVDSAEFRHDAFVEAFQPRFGLFVVKNFISRIIEHFFGTPDPVLQQIDFWHRIYF